MSQPIPVILDVDTGFDDALALLLALRAPQLEVLGITCVVGNQRLPQVVTNTLKILDVAEAPEIPVAAGMTLPLLEPLRTPMLLHGRDGMADLGLPPSSRRPVEVHAVEFLRQALAAATRPVTLIALAPLTNIAVFLRMYPELHSRVGQLMIMGGTYAAAGNTTPLAEFNIRHDPEAAAVVLASGLPIRLYTLDVFRRVAIRREEIEQFIAQPDPVAQVAGRILRHSCDYFRSDRALIGDAGAVAAVIEPEGVQGERLPITVELGGTISRGQTAVDRRPPESRARLREWCEPAPAEVDVIHTVDAARYRALFGQLVGGVELESVNRKM
ncbi:MAG: nucleoside hydrolase [Litorilinea sp.]|nr:MAG: nucleoside hydrolase [Litorilinea sp.]